MILSLNLTQPLSSSQPKRPQAPLIWHGACAHTLQPNRTDVRLYSLQPLSLFGCPLVGTPF